MSLNADRQVSSTATPISPVSPGSAPAAAPASDLAAATGGPSGSVLPPAAANAVPATKGAPNLAANLAIAVAAAGLPTWFEAIEHQRELGRFYGLAPLARCRVGDSEIVGIRDADAYSEEADNFKALSDSLNADGTPGMLNPVHMYVADDREHLNAAGGNRRLSASLVLLRRKVFKDDVKVRCYIYTTSDRTEILRIAARDNAFRINYNELEEFRQVVALKKRGLTDAEVGAQTGMSERTVERYYSISLYDVLPKLLAERMPYSRLARIADALKKCGDPIKKGTMTFLRTWLEVEVPKRRTAKKEEAARKGKTIKASALECGKLLRPGEYEGWVRDLDAGDVPTGAPKVKQVAVKNDGVRLQIDAISLDLQKVTWTEIGAVLADVEGKVVTAIRRAMRLKKAEAEDDQEDGDAMAEALRRKYGLVLDEVETPDSGETEDSAGNAELDDDNFDSSNRQAGFDA